MSKEEEIDWDKILEPGEAKPDLPKETLWIKLERMRQAQDDLPKWTYFKLCVVLLYLLFYIGLIGFLIQTGVTSYISLVFVVILGQVYINIDFFRLVYKLKRRTKGIE